VKGTELQQGDIVLAFGATLDSLIIARYGIPQGRYSHSAMYYRAEDGRGRMLAITGSGLESTRPADFFARTSRLALIRLRDSADTSRLGEAARAMWRRNKTTPLRFNVAFRKGAEGSAAFYCDELVSHLYVQCGLPDPFVQPRDVQETPWIRKVRSYTGVDLISSVSPNAALAAPRFAVLAEVERTGGQPVWETIESVILDKFRTYVGEDGYAPGKPCLGSRVLLALERAVLLRDYLRRLPNPRQREVWYSLLEYLVECRNKTMELLGERGAGQWTDEEVRQVTERVCEAYRDRHLRRESGPAESQAP
jgi:hypothetical protein